MKAPLIALLLLSLATAASAEFTFTGFTGKTMKNAARPDVRIQGKDAVGKTVTELEHYFLWRGDHVKIQSVMYDAGKPNMVRESLFYYADFIPTTEAKESEAMAAAGVKSVEAVLSSRNGASVPTWENTDVFYSEAMRDLVGLTFESVRQGQTFLQKLSERRRLASAPRKRVTLKSRMLEKKNKAN